MSESNRKLDEFVKKEKWKQVRSALFVIPFVLVILWTLFPNIGKVEVVNGVVIRLIGLPSEEGERLYLLVKLDSGEMVRSYIPASDRFRNRGVVKLYKHPPKFFGRTIYKFKGYSEKGA